MNNTAPPRRTTGLETVCDLLLSDSSATTVSRDPKGSARRPPSIPQSAFRNPQSSPPRGLYLLSLGGIEPDRRRSVALAVARCLAPRTAPAALFLFQNGSADAHVLGEPAWSRSGPPPCMESADLARFASACDQVALAVLDGPQSVPSALAAVVRRAVFVATPDAESLVETYRDLKSWFACSPPSNLQSAISNLQSSLFLLASSSDPNVPWFHDRLSRTARRFLDCEVQIQGFLDVQSPQMSPGRSGRICGNTEPLCLFSSAPSAAVCAALTPGPP